MNQQALCKQETGSPGVPAGLCLEQDPRQPCLLTSPGERIRSVLSSAVTGEGARLMWGETPNLVCMSPQE